jgi:hypothetical protein
VVCLVALAGMVLRRGLRAPSAGYWLVASLVFGFGFPAYFWSEPRPLTGRDGSGVPSLTGLRLAAATTCWAALGGAILAAFALLR